MADRRATIISVTGWQEATRRQACRTGPIISTTPIDKERTAGHDHARPGQPPTQAVTNGQQTIVAMQTRC